MAVYYSGDQSLSGLDNHGEMYQAGNAVNTVINTVDVWEEVANFSEGLSHNFMFVFNTLVCGRDGDYELNWSCGAVSIVADKVFEFSISVDDVIQDKFTKQRTFSNTTNSGAMAGVGLLSLTVGQVVKFEVRNITDAADILIVSCDVMIHEI